jgi:hypothetical protein
MSSDRRACGWSCGYLHEYRDGLGKHRNQWVFGSGRKKDYRDREIVLSITAEKHRSTVARTMQNLYGSEGDRAWRQDDSRREPTQYTGQIAACAESTSSDTQRPNEPFQSPVTGYVKCVSCHDLEHLVGDIALFTSALLQRRSASVWGYAMLQMDANVTMNAINASSDKLDNLREQIYETLEEVKRHCSGCDFYRRSMDPNTAHRRQMTAASSDQLVKRVRDVVAVMEGAALDAAAQKRGTLEGWIAHVDQAARLAKDDLSRLRQGISRLDAALSHRQARCSSAPPAMTSPSTNTKGHHQ